MKTISKQDGDLNSIKTGCTHMYIENDDDDEDDNNNDDDDDGLVRMRQGGSTVAWPSLPPDPEHGYDGNQAREHRSRPHQPYRTRSLPSSHHPTPRIATGSGHNSALQCTRSYSTSTLHHHIRPYFTHHMRTTHQRKTTQRVPYCPVTRLVEEE